MRRSNLNPLSSIGFVRYFCASIFEPAIPPMACFKSATFCTSTTPRPYKIIQKLYEKCKQVNYVKGQANLTTFFACQGTWHPLSGLRMYVRILSVLSLITRSWMWLGRIKARGKNLYSAGNILVAQAFADYIELKSSRCERKTE